MILLRLLKVLDTNNYEIEWQTYCFPDSCYNRINFQINVS
jgi:hypothetical protein